MGEVMQESTKIAYTVARLEIEGRGGKKEFFDSNSVHIHVPEGATPKDGPSAGIAMTTALLSLALNKPILPHTAMTGEISLTGKVLPVGGIKEKTIAARRSDAKRLILPKGNEADYAELPDYLKDGLDVCFCTDYEEVFSATLADSAGK